MNFTRSIHHFDTNKKTAGNYSGGCLIVLIAILQLDSLISFLVPMLFGFPISGLWWYSPVSISRTFTEFSLRLIKQQFLQTVLLGKP
jgi:hypothetical protein